MSTERYKHLFTARDLIDATLMREVTKRRFEAAGLALVQYSGYQMFNPGRFSVVFEFLTLAYQSLAQGYR